MVFMRKKKSPYNFYRIIFDLKTISSHILALYVDFYLPKHIIHLKKITHFAMKSSEIIISSRTADSTLQKQSLLYKTQKN
jgi:hypothetical protein